MQFNNRTTLTSLATSRESLFNDHEDDLNAPIVSNVSCNDKVQEETDEVAPAYSSIGISLFFKLLKLSSFNRNPRTIKLVVRTVNSMLEQMPPLALRDDGRTESLNILESVFDVLQGAISNSGSFGNDLDPETVLSAILGLAIKRGSLCHILEAVRLLLAKRDLAEVSAPLEVAAYLQELSDARADVQQSIRKSKTQAGKILSFGKGDHGKLGHGNCSHAHCSEGNCTENKRLPTIIETLKDLKVIKVGSLSTHR